MAKRKTTEQFIQEAEMGVKRANRKGSGKGAKGLTCFARRRPVCGVGINDYVGVIRVDGKHIESYHIWKGLLRRLFNPTTHITHPRYADVLLDPDWIYFSRFKEWWDANSPYRQNGWQLDKDLLSRHYGYSEKIYSPQTCCFLPREINAVLVVQKKRLATDVPIGVQHEKSGNFNARMHTPSGNKIRIGTYHSSEDAFQAYKKAKESYVKTLAEKYKEYLDPRAYEALMAYEVRIDD